MIGGEVAHVGGLADLERLPVGVQVFDLTTPRDPRRDTLQTEEAVYTEEGSSGLAAAVRSFVVPCAFGVASLLASRALLRRRPSPPPLASSIEEVCSTPAASSGDGAAVATIAGPQVKSVGPDSCAVVAQLLPQRFIEELPTRPSQGPPSEMLPNRLTPPDVFNIAEIAVPDRDESFGGSSSSSSHGVAVAWGWWVTSGAAVVLSWRLGAKTEVWRQSAAALQRLGGSSAPAFAAPLGLGGPASRGSFHGDRALAARHHFMQRLPWYGLFRAHMQEMEAGLRTANRTVEEKIVLLEERKHQLDQARHALEEIRLQEAATAERCEELRKALAVAEQSRQRAVREADLREASLAKQCAELREAIAEADTRGKRLREEYERRMRMWGVGWI